MRVALLDDYQRAAGRFPGWSRLPSSVELVVFHDHVASEDDLVARLEGFDAVCRIRERSKLPRNVLERLPQLRLILATGGRNSESLDLEAARDLGIVVSTTSGGGGLAAVEVCWALILSLAHKVHQQAASLRNGGWQVAIGSALGGRTLGIIGLGRHGLPMARIGQAFGMEVLAWSPNLTEARAAEAGVTRVDKLALMGADVVSIHMPLNARTRGLIDAAAIEAMRPGGLLVNVSRGPLVDEAALIAALRSERIAGYGADVFDEEPLPLDHPFRHLPNVLATPHIGFAVEQFFEDAFAQTVENILAYLDGAPIRTIGPGAP